MYYYWYYERDINVVQYTKGQLRSLSGGGVQECADEAEEGGNVCRHCTDGMDLEPELEFALWIRRTMNESIDALGDLFHMMGVKI